MTKDKDEDLFQAIIQYEINILMLQELGLNWDKISRSFSFYERIRTYLKSEASQTKSKMSHNTRDKTGNKIQWGGTGIMSYGKISHFAMGAGSDTSGLGRWTWTRYRGKGGMVLRCISVYQPTDNKTGEVNVWQQHKEYFQSINDDRDPRNAFWEDLDAEMEQWMTLGDQIVLSGDINEDILSAKVTNFFAQHNMRNLLMDRHHLDAESPTTYMYTTESNHKVDGIWGTPNIEVERCGYLEPGDFPGNHSLVWMDITFRSALGHNPPRPKTPDARRLQLWNSKCVKKYIRRYEKDSHSHSLLERQLALERKTTPDVPLTHSQRRNANSIDSLRSKLMKRAEKKCRHLRMGAVAFSEATEAPRREISFWDTALRRRKGYRVSVSLWRRKKKKAKITYSTRNMTEDDMWEERKAAQKRYRTAKNKHKEERKSFLDTLRPKDRDRLQRREAARDLGRACKWITGKLESKSVTKVEIDGKECTKQEEMNAAFMKINYAKIRASDPTAFLNDPLLRDFGERNETGAAEAVLQGTYQVPPNTDPYAARLIQGLKQPPELLPENRPFHPRTKITVEDHIRGWRKAKESTSSGMSGLHFGMFKANATSPRLAQIDASIRSVAYTTGFSYSRWKKGLDVQLLKRSQDFRAEKLRTILLLEADFNMNNKVLGSDAMRSGEHAQTFSRDNYGGRRHLRSVEVAMNSQLTFNSLWARRGRAVLMSNDAAGCYDRIAHVVVDIALRRLGIPKAALQSMLETIQEMDHYIRTAFGDSKTAYRRQPGDPPPQGLLQGNGAGPAGWSSIATVIIQIMEEEGFGYHDWTLIRRRVISLVCFAFVDDTDILHVNNDPNVTYEQLLIEAQTALNLWEGLLRATGGDLAPAKSYWYYIEVIRHSGKWRYRTKTQAPGDLYLKQGTHRIRRNEVTQAEEALGIQASPDGNMKAEFEYLKTKIAKWCDAVRTKRLQPTEAWYCLNSTIMKTIEYPLMATSFSKKQIDELMSPLLRTALPLARIQRYLPRKLVYGTLKARGCNIKYPFWTQLIHHLQAILRHQHRDTPSRDLHDDNAEAVQLHIGSQHPFWEISFDTYGMLAPSGWIKNTWESLQNTPITIKGQNITVPAKREHDRWIMDHFITLDLDNKTLVTLNDCRLFLQATTLSDICTADGLHIDRDCWEGRLSVHRPQQPWVKTYKPTRDAWIQWRHAIQQAFLIPHATHQRLLQPLGRWLSAKGNWQWWKHLSTSTIYQQTSDSQWIRWSLRNHRGSTSPSYHHPTPITIPPPNCVRVSVSSTRRRLRITELNWGISLPPVIDNDPVSLPQRLHRYPESAHWALQHVKITDDGSTIAQALSGGYAIAVSDGSLKMDFGTASYIIEGHNHEHLITGVNQVPGPITEGDSHRCEVSGIYSVVLLVNAIAKHYDLQSGSITMACDNETSLKIFDLDYKPDPQHKNFDLVNATWYLLQQSPIKWKGKHVYGHQEDKKAFHRLSRLEKLNVAMDRQAKSFWRHLCVHNNRHHIPVPVCHPIYGEGWQLWHGDSKITRPSVHEVYSTIQDPITQYWWVRHEHIRAHSAHRADWDATEDLLRHLPLSRRRWVTKTASKNCGVGTTLVAWNFQTDNTCPRCDEEETTRHVYVCNGHSAQTVWDKSIIQLRQYLDRSFTDPDLSEALIYCLTRWRQRRTLYPREIPMNARHVMREQHKLGWQQLLEGLPVKAWRIHQNNYFKSHNIRKSSRRWMRGLLQHIHRLAWNQWNHRNDIKHNTIKPREKRALQLLDSEIVREYQKGDTTLLPGDRHHLRHNLLRLLQKPLDYKKAWLINVTTARQRLIRIQTNDAERISISRRTSTLLRWMRTSRLEDAEE